MVVEGQSWGRVVRFTEYKDAYQNGRAAMPNPGHFAPKVLLVGACQDTNQALPRSIDLVHCLFSIIRWRNSAQTGVLIRILSRDGNGVSAIFKKASVGSL